MEFHRNRAAARVPLTKGLGQTSSEISAGYLRVFSKGSCTDQKSYSVLKYRVREDATETYGLRKLSAQYNPRDFYPSKVELHLQQSFGKNNPLKSYTVLPIVSQIAVIVWKSGYLSEDEGEPTALAKVSPGGETTLAMISNLAQVDFAALKLLPFEHDIYDDREEEKKIIANKKVMRNECLLHYDMNLSALQRYCGGKWTSEHWRTDEMLQVMSHILPNNLFLELATGLIDGVPNLLNTEIPSKEVASLLSTSNLPTVAKNLESVDKAILKK